MQTSLTEKDLEEATQQIMLFEEEELKSENYKQMYEDMSAKFTRLLESSKNTIKQLVSTAHERELNIQKQAAEKIKPLLQYKDIVMKMTAQQAQKQAALNAGIPK